MTDQKNPVVPVVPVVPATDSVELPQKILRVFKSYEANVTFLTAKAKSLHFFAGRFSTDNKDDIAELQKEVDSGHPQIYVDSKETTQVGDARTPEEILKAKIIQEYLADQKKKTDFGNTQAVGSVLGGIANSTTISQGAAGSDSTTSAQAQAASAAALSGGTPAQVAAPANLLAAVLAKSNSVT